MALSKSTDQLGNGHGRIRPCREGQQSVVSVCTMKCVAVLVNLILVSQQVSHIGRGILLPLTSTAATGRWCLLDSVVARPAVWLSLPWPQL